MTAPCTSHIFGTRTRCLRCDQPAPAPEPADDYRDDLDERLSDRPAVWRAHGETRTAGIDDIAGWGEAGNPWTGGGV